MYSKSVKLSADKDGDYKKKNRFKNAIIAPYKPYSQINYCLTQRFLTILLSINMRKVG